MPVRRLASDIVAMGHAPSPAGGPVGLPLRQISPTARGNKGPGREGAAMPQGLMAGKRGLVMGVANERPIAWGIAQACREQGAELACTYQGDARRKRVEPLAASLGSDLVLPCDVAEPASIDAVFDELGQRWERLDFVLHAIA